MCFTIGDTIIIEQQNLLNERYDKQPLLDFQVVDVGDRHFSAVRVDGKNDTIRRFDKRSKKSKIKFGIYYKAYLSIEEYENAINKKNEMDSFIANIETSLVSMNHIQLQNVAEYVDSIVM